MLGGKDYRTVDMVFLFVAGFIDRATRPVEQTPTSWLRAMSSERASHKMGYDRDEMTGSVRPKELRQHITEFNQYLRGTLNENCETGFSTLKFHFLRHVLEAKEQFGCLQDF